MDTEQHTLDKEITDVIESMEGMSPEEPAYEARLKALRGLVEIRKMSRINPEVVLGAIANIGGILLILNHERLNVITTKAFALLRKN